MNVKTALIGAVAATALAVAPLTQASAHGYRHFGLIGGIFALGAAAVVGAATAPLRVLAGPGPAYAPAPPPAYYPPAPGYYAAPAPRYYAPPAPYYAPPPAYYSAPYGYYGR